MHLQSPDVDLIEDSAVERMIEKEFMSNMYNMTYQHVRIDVFHHEITYIVYGAVTVQCPSLPSRIAGRLDLFSWQK